MTAVGEAREMTAAVAIEHEWMLPCEVAELLRMSERTLEGKRLNGTGPDYYRVGPSSKSRVLYRHGDVTAWLEKHKVTAKAE